MLVIWNERARPSRLISCGVRPPIAGRRNRICRRSALEVARDQVEQRGLARAVRADQRVALGAAQVEVHAADDLGRAEGLAQALRAEECGSLMRHLPRFRSVACRSFL
jgi:hypothetical protein